MFKVVQNTNRVLLLGVGGGGWGVVSCICLLKCLYYTCTCWGREGHVFCTSLTILIILDDTCNKPDVDIVGNLLEKTLIQWNVCW